MAGGKIIRITGGVDRTITENFTGYYENLTMTAGGENIFTAGNTILGTPKEPERKTGYFVKGWWTNHKDEPIKRAVYGQKLRFHVQMNKEKVSVGDIVYFSLYDSDMRSWGNDTIKQDDPIKLEHRKSKEPYIYEKVDENHKIIIEFNTNYADLANASFKDEDGVFELYFWCSYKKKGETAEHISLPLSFRDYLNLSTIVIDRYKMPGLNPQGTGIAEDMAYGMGKPFKDKNIYAPKELEAYKKEYADYGFMEKHIVFANGALPEQKEKMIEEVVLVGKKKTKPLPPAEADNTKVERPPVSIEDIVEAQEKVRKNNEKAIYSREEIEKLGYLVKMTSKLVDEKDLWLDFRHLKALLAWGELSPVLDAMIDKFKRNEGGFFENEILTKAIKENPNTKKYCQSVEDYIAEQLKNNFSKLEIVEDNEPYFKEGEDIKNSKKNRKEINKINKEFNRPAYSYWDKNNLVDNLISGKTLALNDIWATEVILKELYFDDEKKYFAKYQVTLWDHFGLDKPDLEKFYSYGAGFRAWFVLQHLKGYKPFLTKITFEKEFKGDLEKGLLEREEQREQEKKEKEEFNQKILNEEIWGSPKL